MVVRSKKLFLLLCLVIAYIAPVFADVSFVSFEPLNVEFTVEETVYAGFTDHQVSTTIKPDDISEFKFSYNSDSNAFIVSNVWYYIQTFTASNISATLSSTPLSQGENGQSINWSGTVDDSGYSCGEVLTVVNEPEGSYEFPRVYSGEIRVSIPVNDVTDTNAAYTATLTLKVEAT